MVVNNLKGTNILVTGGGGFIGGHLVKELINQKSNVVVVDNNLNKRSYFFTEHLHEKSKVIKLDICDFKNLIAVIRKFKIDCIFHLAAKALIEDSYLNPKKTLENNIIGSLNILEATRINRFVKQLIIASSDKAYGDLHQVKYKETDPLQGDHPYDVSKAATDLMGQAYFKTYQIPLIIARFGNVYGEGDLNFSRLIPSIMDALVHNKELVLRSDGTFIRDYIYVQDVVSGYILLANNFSMTKGRIYNFGSEDTLSVMEVVEICEKICKKKINLKILNSVKNEIPYQSLDYTNIRKDLRWKPKYTLKKKLPQIFRWYKNYYEK